MPTPRLTAQLLAEICARLKAGAFDQVAAESLGVPFSVFQDWLQRGQKKNARGLVRRLADAVMEARAHARLQAEMSIRKDDAKVWLLQGPGRDSPGRAGWGAANRAHADAAVAAELVARWLALLALLLEALEPFPEARQTVAPLIAEFQENNRADSAH